jgi:hypothetical protein
MRSDWKSALRILAMAALTIGFLPSLPASAGSPDPQAQAPQQKTQESAARRGDATSKHADADGQDQSDSPDSDQQLITNMREQLDREAMDRVRNGGYYHQNTFVQVFDDFGGFLIFLVIVSSLLWIVRTALEHRRWHKMVRVQTETHTKLLDKFGSSQDMLTYMESEAGKRFLETPVFDAQNKRSVALPYGRILWSAQVGIIAAIFGMGILMLRSKAPNPDADLGFQVFGTLVTTLGVGFLVSGGVSYLLARYMGLLVRPEEVKSRAALGS